MDYLRKKYNLKIKVGDRLKCNGKYGVIVGASGEYLRIRLDGETQVQTIKPNDIGVTYL